MQYAALNRGTLVKTLLLLLLGGLSVGMAHAGCTVVFTTLAFGNYTGSVSTATNTATVNCSNGSTYTVGLNAGVGIGGTETTRVMTGLFGTLTYGIFMNPSHTNNWGNTPGNEVSGTGTGSNQVYYGYGQILGSQYSTPGTYTDTVSSGLASFLVSATIQASCSISASALTFGTYAGTTVTASSTLSVQCTNTTPYSIGLSAGTTSGATVTNRLLAGSSGGNLAYALYSDAGHTNNWGATSNTVSGTGTGAVQAISVYGQIAGGQHAIPGSYTDTITATLTY